MSNRGVLLGIVNAHASDYIGPDDPLFQDYDISADQLFDLVLKATGQSIAGIPYQYTINGWADMLTKAGVELKVIE